VEYVFRLIDQIRQQLVYDELRLPGEDRRTAFDFGRLHGIMFALETMQRELAQHVEEVAIEQDRREREF
jgi:hypothetical protein